MRTGVRHQDAGPLVSMRRRRGAVAGAVPGGGEELAACRPCVVAGRRDGRRSVPSGDPLPRGAPIAGGPHPIVAGYVAASGVHELDGRRQGVIESVDARPGRSAVRGAERPARLDLRLPLVRDAYRPAVQPIDERDAALSWPAPPWATLVASR